MIIKEKKELKETIEYEKKIYLGSSSKARVKDRFVKYRLWSIFQYLKALRKTEFYFNNKNKNIYFELRFLFAERKKNKIGNKLGIEICNNSVGKGLFICHAGSIVINGEARLGENCILHGDNCIGNDGSNMEAPIIGDNVDIGVGAKIIGDVKVADKTVIGAGAVVVNSFEEAGSLLVGVPAKKIK